MMGFYGPGNMMGGFFGGFMGLFGILLFALQIGLIVWFFLAVKSMRDSLLDIRNLMQRQAGYSEFQGPKPPSNV